MRNEEQNNIKFENEPVSQLLAGLKRVEAPGDFDFRVKARIAAGRPADKSRSWFPSVARLAVPLGLLLSVGGYLSYNSIYQPDNVAMAPVAENKIIEAPIVSDVQLNEPVSLPARNENPERAESKPITDINSAVPVRRNEKRIVSSAPSNRRPGGGSIDLASRKARVVLPKGIDPNGKVIPRGFERNSGVSAKDILSFMGVDADSTWKVGSVKQNSMAERSGLKAGDVIEAINNQNLNEKSVFGNKFNGKNMRVSRDGKSMQIELKP